MAHRDALTAALARVEALESEVRDLRAQRGPRDIELGETVRVLREQLRSATDAMQRVDAARSVAEAALSAARAEHAAERAIAIATRDRDIAIHAMEAQVIAARHRAELAVVRAGETRAQQELARLRAEVVVLRTRDVAQIRAHYESSRQSVLRDIALLEPLRHEITRMQASLEAAEREALPEDPVRREMQKNVIARDRAILEAKRELLRVREPAHAEELRAFDALLAALG